MDKTLARQCLAHLITNFQWCRHQPQCTCERVAGVLHAVAHDGGRLYGPGHCWCELQGQHVIHPSYYDACDVSCDVIYYVITVRARRMVRIFFLPFLGNRSNSDPCSYELFCLESHILSFPKVLQIPPGSPCMCRCKQEKGLLSTYTYVTTHRNVSGRCSCPSNCSVVNIWTFFA